jgi:hypothetical protein
MRDEPWAKSYGIKVRAIGNVLRNKLGNLGIPWEP